MATSLGSLVVSLGLNAAEFTLGLNKAEFEAQKFARTLDKAIASAANAAAIAITAVATAATAAVVAIDQLAKEAARFKDLEEITGASAESLASFAVAAKIAGTDMNSIADASVKLTKNLTGVDDESTAAGAALTALGINIKDFKQLDPATQIETISKALGGFADGAGKTAVALALFGKAGAQLLPFLKELGTGIGRQNILTQEQIELADKYADAQAAATAKLHLLLEVASTQAIPVFTAVTTAAKAFASELLGIDTNATNLGENNAVEVFAIRAAKALAATADVADALLRIFQVVNVTLEKGVFKAGPDISAILARATASQQLAKTLEELDANRKFPGEGGGRRRNAPPLDFQGKAGKGSGADRQSEADRFLESLRKQLEKTEELTVAETILRDIQEGRLKFLSPAQQTQALGLATQIDQAHELAAAIKEINKTQEEENRVAQAAVKARNDAANAALNHAEQIKDSNRQLSDEIEIITGGVEAQKRLERAHIEGAIAINEQLIAEREFDDALKGTIPGLEQQIVFLKERLGLLTRKDIAINLKAEADAMNAFKNTITDEFANAFEGFIDSTKSAKDAFKDFATSVQKYLTNLALHKIGDVLFGSTTAQGPDIFSMLPKLLGIGGSTATGAVKAATDATGATALAGSATALTGAGGALTASSGALDGSAVAQTTAAGLLSGAAGALSGAALALTTASATGSASDIAGLLGSGIGLAQGGGLASGSNFTFGGGTWVGEHGPEFVDMPRGARVWPTGTGPSSMNGGDTITINMQVLPGANTQTARQAGNFVRDAVSARARDR